MKIDLSKSKLNKTDSNIFTKDVNDILDKHPVLKNLDITVEFSNRLKTTAGNVKYKIGRYIISISTKNVQEFGIQNGLGTLRHEFAHILDFLKNNKFSHGYDFKVICEALGGHMNSQMAGKRFANCATDNFIKSPFKYEYKCPCGKSFMRKGKLRNLNRVCMVCHTKIKDMTMVKL